MRGATALTELECGNNQLKSLDVSKNTELTRLYCEDNQLSITALDTLFGTLNRNAGEKYIWIGNNPGTDDRDRSIAEDKGWIVFE